MNKWIKLTDKFPDFNKIVAVILNDKNIRVAKLHKNTLKEDGKDYFLYSEMCWYCLDNDYETIPINDVNHWCLLPELPV